MAQAAILTALVAVCGGVECVAKTPFFSEETTIESAVPVADPLRMLDLRGVVRIDDQVRVCFVDAVSNKATWVTVGAEGEGLVADEYDPDKAAVLARSGTATRWFTLRETRIMPVPIAVLADGSVDVFHMSLSEKEKAEEARAMLGDILEVARLGRAGKLGNRGSKQGSRISQPR